MDKDKITIQQDFPSPLTPTWTPAALEGMTKGQLDAKLQHNYEQAIAHQGRPLEAALSDLERNHNPNVSAVDSISGILRGKTSESIDRHSLKEEIRT